jgi:peptidoglycan-N-acetylglucosamine deacetylase
MGDDRFYRLQTAAGALWEIPVQWTLDDAAWLAHPSDPAGMFAVWAAELRCARREERHVTLTLHPEIIGMGHRIDGLRRLLAGLAADGFASESHGTAIACAVQD